MIINFIHRLILAILDAVLPLKCLRCGKNKSYLCKKCKENLIESSAPICSEIKEIKVFSALSYKNPLTKKLIWHLKYRNKRQISGILADIILAKLKFLKNPSDKSSAFSQGIETNEKNSKIQEMSLEKVLDKIIIPVPISKKRLRQRGYNQTVLMARDLSLKTGIPVFQNILTKKFNTPSQMETKTKSERIKNLKNSFEVPADGTRSTVNRDFTVLLLDDVITTGATLNEAAKTLKLAGFKKIIGITVAKG